MILLLKILCRILFCDIFIFIFMGYDGKKIKNIKYFELKIMKIIFKNLKFICTILNCNYINIYEGIRKNIMKVRILIY